MKIDPPLSIEGYEGDLKLQNGHTTLYLSDLVMDWDGRGIHALWGITSTALACDSMSASLRDHDKMSLEALYGAFEWSYRDYPYTKEWKLQVRHIRQAHVAEKDIAIDRIRCGQAWQLAMYPTQSRLSGTNAQFTLLLDYTWDMQEIMAYIFNVFNRRLAMPLAPEWVAPIWDHLVESRYLEQLHSFGRVVGFKVNLDEDAIRRFVSYQIRIGNLFLPGIRDEARLAA
jgi:hypothetical protein